MDQHTAQKLINKTRDDYNLIAEHFARTRYYIWNDIEEATKNFDLNNKKVLDLGCGNGRLYEFLTSKGVKYTGLDLSEKLIKIAKNKYPEGSFVSGNLLNTPFKDGEFDFIYCVATLHHIPSKELREKAIKEIYRILKPGGQIFFTNWYFWNKPNYIKQIFADRKLPFGDFMMPWKKQDTSITTSRYFHAWSKFEMRLVLIKVGFKKIRIGGFKGKIWLLVGRNLLVTAQKPE